MKFDVIGNRNYFLGFSGVMMLLAIGCVIFLGFHSGIDLVGGTQWQIVIQKEFITESSIQDAIRPVQNIEIPVKKGENGSFILRLPHLTEENRLAYLSALNALGPVEEKNFSSIGPTVGSELRQKALWAIVVVLFAISMYIAYAFRKVSEPIKSWKYGVATLISLFHDVVIPAGLLAFLGWCKGIEIDTNSIVALLVVMGFSVHDTIVVFDRIREHLLRGNRKLPFMQIINESVNETFTRSINTSLTLVLVLVTMLIFGPSSLFYFILTILVGTIFGTYSSIFVASPLLYLWGRNKLEK